LIYNIAPTYLGIMPAMDDDNVMPALIAQTDCVARVAELGRNKAQTNNI